MKNVYGDPAYADTRKELEAGAQAVTEQYKDEKPNVTDKELRPKRGERGE
jgi:hypothetical protein